MPTDNECLLQADAAHIDMQAILHRLFAVAWIQHASAGALDQKRDDIAPHKVFCYARSLDIIEALLRVEEEDETAESHVYECVDP